MIHSSQINRQTLVAREWSRNLNSTLYYRAFANFVRMDAQKFQYFLDAVSQLIVYKDTGMRDAIPPAERLVVSF